MPILSIIVPCYNEEEVLPETASRLEKKLSALIMAKSISAQSHIMFIDDGSKDNTWPIIQELHKNNSCFTGIKLSKNKGHQNALMCGLLSVRNKVDAAITMDADLQDDVDLIDTMIEKYKSGFEIVYGVRGARQKDTFFKKITALLFYRLMRFLGVNIIFNHADFRLMGKRALSALSDYREVNLFLRGLVPMLGYNSCIVHYERAERFAGTSKYPLGEMLKFAFEGITSLSIKPIRLITILGVLIFLVSLVMIIYFIVRHFSGYTVVGWSSIVCSLWGIGGLTLFSIGIVGEYIGKIYLETKQRPRYHIEDECS